MKKIEIKEYTKYSEEEILPIYKALEWVNYSNNPEMLRKSYENSLYKLIAVVDDKTVGVLRIVGDGESIIYIQDILVLPDYQRHGIGKMLLSKALEKYSDVYQKVLLTDNTPKTIAFYKALGFSTDIDIGCIAFVQFNN